MKFHKEGYASLIVVILFGAALIFIVRFATDNCWIHWLVYAISGFLLLTILQFFRSPNRKIVPNDHLIISPADGKIVVIEEVEETEFLNERRIQVSIFMSPVNVHLNRYPIGGIVKYVKYHPGKYLVAWHPKSSTENERTTIVVEDKNKNSVLFRQIAGAMARRIVYYCKEGDEVKQGNECGFIKFGSRVDLLLPLNFKINAKIGDMVKGGESIIAQIP